MSSSYKDTKCGITETHVTLGSPSASDLYHWSNSPPFFVTILWRRHLDSPLPIMASNYSIAKVAIGIEKQVCSLHILCCTVVWSIFIKGANITVVQNSTTTPIRGSRTVYVYVRQTGLCICTSKSGLCICTSDRTVYIHIRVRQTGLCICTSTSDRTVYVRQRGRIQKSERYQNFSGKCTTKKTW